MTIARSVEHFLNTRGLAYEVVSHPRTLSTLSTAQAAHIPGDRLAKSVLLNDDGGYLMAVIPATHRIDFGKLHHQLHRHVGLATEDEVAKVFPDCDRGAFPALGPAYRIDTIVDDTLLQQPDVYFEGGDHEALVHMSGVTFSAIMASVPHGQFTHHI